ncbi:MAG: HIT domain-containing protein [Candidatus Omnitrophota bacterium]
MDKLWAPWRIRYIRLKKDKSCIFCKALKTRKNYVILKSRYSFVMLNIFPYNNGHLLISPIRHISRLEQLNDSEITDLFKTMTTAKKLLDKILKPHGYNIGINISEAAGAGETRHLHIHIVPRWKGDTNFISTINNTKVISQSLDELYKKLKSLLSKRKNK